MDNNAENLHDVGKSAKKNSDKWVNPGTPAAALVSESDLQNAETSKDGTEKLRAAMSRDASK